MERNGLRLKCPQCRVPIERLHPPSQYRLRVSTLLKFPCPHDGCPLTQVEQNVYNDHVEQCQFRPGLCPIVQSGCMWTGSAEDVLNHIRSDHKYVRFIKTSANFVKITLDAISINMNQRTWFFVIVWRGKTIIVHVTLGQARLKFYFKSNFTLQESIPKLKLKFVSSLTEGLSLIKTAKVFPYHQTALEPLAISQH